MLSLLMPNYNNGRFIEQAIGSVLAQTSPDWELVVVDDASEDDSIQRVERFLDDPRIRLIRQERNTGLPGALLRALEVTQGEIFGIVAPDDALHPQAVELLSRAHQDCPGSALIYSTLVYCDAELVPKEIPDWVGPVRTTCLREDRISSFAVYSRAAYDRTDGFDPVQRLAEDKDIYSKMEEVGPVLFLPLALYYYRRHDAGISQGPNRTAAFLYHARALLLACERRRARGLAGLSRREAAAALFRLASKGLRRYPGCALHYIRKALLLDPLNAAILKTYVRCRLRGLRAEGELP